MNYRKVIEAMSSWGLRVAQAIPSSQIPENSVIVMRDEQSGGFIGKLKGHNETLFTLDIGGNDGINDQIRRKVQELNLANSRFFYQYGREDRFTDITSKVI